MLSVFLDSGPNHRHLALTLAPLVSGAVEGIVREVGVIDRGLDEEARKVADYAGCRIITPSDLPEAFGGARGQWLFLLEAGARPLTGWTSIIADHIARAERGTASPQAARLKAAAMDRPRFLARLARRASALETGLVLKKAQAIGLLKQRGPVELADLVKGIASTRLRAEIRPKRAADDIN